MKTYKVGEPTRAPTMFINAWGSEGVGKTSFLLSFPPPLYILNFDRSIEHFFPGLPAGYGEVYYESFADQIDGTSRAVAQKCLTACETLAKEAMAGGKGSFLIDGGHRFVDIVRICKLGTANPEDKRDYHFPNEYTRAFFLALENSALQVGIAHPASSVWESRNTESDRVKVDGFKHLPAISKISLFMFVLGREAEVSPKLVEAAIGAKPTNRDMPRHWGQIRVCKHDTSLEDKVYPNVSFSLLHNLCFKRDWSESGDELYEPG